MAVWTFALQPGLTKTNQNWLFIFLDSCIQWSVVLYLGMFTHTIFSTSFNVLQRENILYNLEKCRKVSTTYIHLMDCYLFDIHWLLEAFRGVRIWNFDIKSADGVTLFFVKGEICQVSNILVKIRVKDYKSSKSEGNWTLFH